MKDKLGGKIIAMFAALKPKTYSYLIDTSDKNKKAKETKMCIIKWKFKFKDYRNCLEATHLENEIKHLEKKTLDIDSLNRNHKEIIKNNILILKTPKNI